MPFRQFLDRFFHQILQLLSVEIIIRPARFVRSLEHLLIVLSEKKTLKVHQRTAARVTQFVLGQVGGDCIEPGGKLPLLIETMDISIYPDKCILQQVFSTVAISDNTVDIVDDATAVAPHQLVERPLLAFYKELDKLFIRLLG